MTDNDRRGKQSEVDKKGPLDDDDEVQRSRH